jgi:phage terminase large subunit
MVRFFSGSKESDEALLRSEVKKITNSISDSEFLRQLKHVNDKDLEAAIQVAVDLACTQLSSSIDAAVKKMTHRVLQMQQDECKKSMQREIETEERKEVDVKLADFIHAINEVSARRRTS